MGGKFETRAGDSVETLLAKSAWHHERKALRALALGLPLHEEVKWGKLCYTFNGHSVAMIYGLKAFCALGFFKGALLKDPTRRLDKPGENSQAMRWLKFTGLEEIEAQVETINAYLHEAITVEEAGLTIDFKAKEELVFPDELKAAFAADAALERAFLALTPGRQRGYNLFFSQPKQAATRSARIAKMRPRIFAGKGRNER